MESGTQFGLYEILSPIGAGGMGEVYRARDTKLARVVALKILPDVFARDQDRMSRFRREAQLLASLNHPHIATIYGVEESGGRPALVLEYVDGETLAERIGARGESSSALASPKSRTYCRACSDPRNNLRSYESNRTLLLYTPDVATKGFQLLGNDVPVHAFRLSLDIMLSCYPSAVNIERTMQFILEAQARAEVRAEKQDLRTKKNEARVAAVEKRLDRRMDAISKLLHQGMQILVRTESRLDELAAAQKEMAAAHKELAAAQKDTDRSLKQLIDGLIRGRNGH